jgi:hypothetical protein
MSTGQKPLLNSDHSTDPRSAQYEAFFSKLRFGNQSPEELDPGLTREEQELLGIPGPKVPGSNRTSSGVRGSYVDRWFMLPHVPRVPRVLLRTACIACFQHHHLLTSIRIGQHLQWKARLVASIS